MTTSGHQGVVIIHPYKRATRVRLDICLTAKVLDHSFTRAVCDRGHVERTSLLFAAVESYLSKRQVCSQFQHCVVCEKRVIVVIAAYSTVWCLKWQLEGRWAFNHNVRDKKPASWNQARISGYLTQQRYQRLQKAEISSYAKRSLKLRLQQEAMFTLPVMDWN